MILSKNKINSIFLIIFNYYYIYKYYKNKYFLLSYLNNLLIIKV